MLATQTNYSTGRAQPPEQRRLHRVHARFLPGKIHFQVRQPRPRARHKLPQLIQNHERPLEFRNAGTEGVNFFSVLAY